MSSFLSVVTGNPFSTPVGSKIEQATDGSLASENWALNMEICDLINETEDGPKDAIKAIRKRLQQAVGKNYTIVMFTLTVLETCVKNCGKRFHILVCNKEFVNELVRLIGPKNGPPQAVQEKVLYLIQSWVDAFHRHPDLRGVVEVYTELKAKGVEFPMTDLDAMAPIHTPKKSVSARSEVDSSVLSKSPGGTETTMTLPTIPSLTPDQLSKLRADLDGLQTNMAVFGEMLNEMTPGSEHPSDIQLFKELCSTLTAMQERLVELISRLSNDEMTADLLRINDHLNNLFLRYSRYEKNRGAVKDELASRNAAGTGDSLIDLGDEAVGGAGPPASTMPALTKHMESMGLGSQLANISSVSAKSGSAKPADVDDSEFDMFAQSRKVTYESSKTGGSTYESNVKPDQVDGSLSGAMESKAQGVTPGATMHKESDFDEMAKWLGDGSMPSLGGEQESLTSSEFERFLAERAAAAEALPQANSASGNQPKKSSKDPHDSSLYAL
uniref:TOM1-like protein 2 n=1 Tax=Lygus hesperus TaxID=30085 RepID=A0A0K8SGD7_LYGHE